MNLPTSGYTLRPWTVKQALPWVASVHRRLPRVQGGMWSVRVLGLDGETVGAALVGHAARALGTDTLSVLRVAVLPGLAPAGRHAAPVCSMLYGACSRAARAMGATRLVTYTHRDEPGVTLRAAGWLCDGLTTGVEHSRPSRPRRPAVDPSPKWRWWAPWSVT